MIVIGQKHTLELVLADIDETWRIDHVGGEVIDHLGAYSKIKGMEQNKWNREAE